MGVETETRRISKGVSSAFPAPDSLLHRLRVHLALRRL